jgi:CelD/BcsL family acetyltransferase involved in cellulose biosynthesis
MTNRFHIESPAAEPVVAGRPATQRPLRVDVVTAFGEGGIAPEEWNGLLERSGGFVYGTHEWQSAWWSSFGGRRRLHILKFSADDGVVAIAPLFLEHSGGSLRLRLIGSGEAYTKSGGRFLDDGPGDYLDFIADPAYAGAVANAFWSWLGSPGRPGRIDLVNLRTEGVFLTAILPAMPEGRFTPVARDADRCPFIPVAGDAAAFLGSLRGSARRRYGQAYRLVDAPAEPLRRVDDDLPALGRVFDDLARLHQERWNALGFTGLFHDETRLRFHKTVVERFASRGWVRYSSIYDGPRCVAARIAFAYGGRMYDYLSGFDESSRIASRRPGLGLLVALYGAAHREGLTRVDLLRGDEAYKFELTTEAGLTRNVTILAGGAGRGNGAAGRALGAAAATLEFASFLAGREAELFRVQAARHGTLRAIPRYIGFRTARLRNRLRSTAQHQPAPPATPAETLERSQE